MIVNLGNPNFSIQFSWEVLLEIFQEDAVQQFLVSPGIPRDAKLQKTLISKDRLTMIFDREVEPVRLHRLPDPDYKALVRDSAEVSKLRKAAWDFLNGTRPGRWNPIELRDNLRKALEELG
jgi:hypothetical protein